MPILPRLAVFVLISAATGLVALPGRAHTPPADTAAVHMVSLNTGADLLNAPGGTTGDFDVARSAPTIDFAVLPGQWTGGKLWSSWGNAVCAPDGNYYASTGDHDGPHGHSYLYQINPSNLMVSLVTDVNLVLGLTNKQDYAGGKIHAPIINPGNGSLFFETYRGAPPGPTFRGDWLLRYDLASGKTESWGVMVPGMSAASMVLAPATHLIYGLSVPPMGSKTPADGFFVYDLDRTGVVFSCQSGSRLSRACFVDADGKGYWDSNGVIACYDPVKGTVSSTAARIPSNGTLRAASAVSRNGIAYGITSDGMIFAFDTRTAKIRELTRVFAGGPGYTAVCQLDPTERFLYYIPGSHGGTRAIGTAVIQLNLSTGRRKVLAFLQSAVAEQFHYYLGGSFGFALNRDGSQMMISWNGTENPKKKDFGACSVMLLNLPASER